MPFTKRNAAAMQLETAIKKIDEGPKSTTPELTREFFEALTIFASTMTGHTSVIANADDDVNEFMFIYRKE